MRTLLLSLLGPLAKLLPETRFFALKRGIYRLCGAQVGENVRICSSVTILGPGQLRIGPNTWVGHQALIVSGCCIDIGAEVDIAPRVFLGTGTHERGSGGKAAGAGVQNPVIVGDGCWLGVGALILPGVSLAAATIVGAGAVVVRGTAEPGQVIAGNPARQLERRGSEDG